jgi:Uncharacterised nucleotidyltransferase
MSAEWAALVECAKPQPDARSRSEFVRKPTDWPTLWALADEHGMLPLLAARLQGVDESSVPQEFRDKIREWQRSQIVFSLSLNAELFRLLDRFSSAGLEVLLTKGPALAARCYGDPGSRQYTDLDLIVRDQDIQRATEMMIALEYDSKVPLRAIEAKKFPGEYVFSQRATGLIVEFHTERTFRYHPRPLPVERLFDRRACVRFDGHDAPVLSVEDELILICIHGAKHFWTRLMWIADVAALISRRDVDWDRALLAAREVGAERMLRIGLQLSADVLGVQLPQQIVAVAQADPAAKHIAAQITRRLPLGEAAPFGLLGRAMFRIRMRGGYFQGAAYLLRLSLSPTEEDWVSGSEERRSWLLDAIGRPLRLARKYGRDGRT